MPADGLGIRLINLYLYNDKELFEDADLNWYDYGFRNYDSQVARFTQLDPLTWDYPELTNYQYASDEPIANVDMDGLEKYLSLEPIVFKVTLKSTSKASNIATKVIERLSLITARGVSDALVNANTFGLSDLMGNNHLDAYKDPEEQAAYLRGRLGGDAIATAQGSTEVDGGAGAVLSTGVETAGVGAAAGLVVGLHGAGIGATAAYYVSWALEKLYRLNASASGSADGRTSPQEKKFEPLANTKTGKEAVSDVDFKNSKPNHPDYSSPKNWNGKKVRNPNGKGTGFPDKNGDVWVPQNHKGTHGNHWDVQMKNGRYRTVDPLK